MLGLAPVALAAQWHIHFAASNHSLAIGRRRPKSKRSAFLAQFANRSQFLHLFTQWNQLSDVLECTTQECALQSRNQDYLTRICSHLGKLSYVRKKLPFVNTNYVVFQPLVPNLAKVVQGDSITRTPIMSRNCMCLSISHISAKLNSEHALARYFMLSNSAQKFGRFARKHGAHDKLDATALVEVSQTVYELTLRIVLRK